MLQGGYETEFSGIPGPIQRTREISIEKGVMDIISYKSLVRAARCDHLNVALITIYLSSTSTLMEIFLKCLSTWYLKDIHNSQATVDP